MSNTSNLDLERPDKGDAEWHTSLNSNMLKLDTGYGNNVATIADLPQVYIETGTFDHDTGDTITLPVAVDAINEYSVEITATTGAGTDPELIWVEKGTTNFVVKCNGNNTTDTFDATIYYIGDIASYGGSIYRRWYVSPDAGITDHSVTATVGSLAYVVDQIGASPAIIEMPANKTYVLTANSVSLDDSTRILFQPGAIIQPAAAKSLTVDSPSNIWAGTHQNIIDMANNSTNPLVFTNPGTVYPDWWGENTTPGTTDMIEEIQAAVDSITSGDVYFQHQTYIISSPIIPESSVNFVGFGTIKLEANADDDMFDITGADTDIGFYDLTFDGNGANQTRADTVNIIDATTQVKRITIKNCTFKNAGSRAVLFNAGLAHEDIIVAGNRFIDYYANGVVFWGVIRGVISDNVFDNSAITPDGNGGAIGVGNISTDITVSGNSIDIGDSQVATFGIETGQVGTTRISITGNTINCRDYAFNDGISIASTTDSVVSGNSITKAQYIGAIEVAGSSSISVTGNSILDIDTHGIAINAANHTISVTGNVIDSYTNAGISVQKSTGSTATIYGISIIGNTLTNGTGLSAASAHAIWVNGGPANGLVVSNNIIYNNPSAYGIHIVAAAGDSATGFIVSGNIIYNVLNYWIAFSGTHTGHIITGNSVTSGGTALLTGTGYVINNNFPDTEELTTGSPTLSRYLGTAYINSVGGAITGTLGSGYYIGQIKTIVMTEASTSSTITFTNMSETVGEPELVNGTGDDGEIATFNAVDEAWVGIWTGTEWMTLRATCTFV